MTEAWREDKTVKFRGNIVDEEIANKVRQGLVNSVSVGLHVRDFEDIEIDGRELKKLNGITVKELSIVIFPAVEGATFEPSFEFSFDELEDQSIDSQLSEADLELMEEVLVSKGRFVMDKKDYESITNQLESMKVNYDIMKKTLWLYSNCDEQFINETISKIDKLDEEQIEFLWKMYQDMSNNFEAQGIVASEDAQLSNHNESKEDVREVIFGVRRDGKLKGLRSIKDIKI